jgi:flagellar basal-body rod modification protein FlgD
MDISQTTSTPANTIAATGQQTDGITSDFDTFLRMLTVQMQNQDPLNPVDSTDYATQLATFSQVEQAVLTNDLLKSLTTQLTSGGLADMAAWVGKEARAAAPAYFDGAPITLSPNPALLADQAEVIVRNDTAQRSNVLRSRSVQSLSNGPVLDRAGFPCLRDFIHLKL